MLDGMTNIKASEVLKELKHYTEDLPHYSPDEVAEALEMAIKALELMDKISKRDIERFSEMDYTDGYNKGWVDGRKALEEQQPIWIPIKTRPMTEEEKEEIGHEYAYMYDCPLPDDGQDVLITDCWGNVEEDTFCRDYEGCYFETNCDDGEVIAWMPKPQPYKAESEE